MTVVTGFLGAGKTTLLNRILGAGHGRSYAVIVNEYGDIGLDGALIRGTEEELIELSSGCVCCVLRGDLIRTVRALLKAKQVLDGIFVETTGLAHPGPILQTFLVDPLIAARCRLNSVVALADAHSVLERLDDSAEAADQIASANLVILNKVSDAPADRTRRAEAEIARLNPFAEVLKTDRAAIAPERILQQRAFAPERIAALLDAAPERQETHGHDGHAHHDHHGRAGAGISSVSCLAESPLDRARIESWLEDLLASKGADILRIKGILAIEGHTDPFVLHGVNMTLEGAFTPIPRTGPPNQSRLVFIGRDLDAPTLKSEFAACAAQS
ncbi:GTP-binding protein [Actibacterium sp. MT2.3-13A]|uniref:CobW family GTP-binding protein n=1 Tax=Actibacterium sp. MT2.3-13A TaxID=2828332 RepID=UPI001BA5B8A7